MKHTSLALVLAAATVLLFSCVGLAADEPLGVAVMNFQDAQLQQWWGWSWNVGEGMTQLVTDELARRGTFRLFERTRLNDILGEKGLAQSGDLDPSTTIELGKLMGVRLMILGTVTEFDLRSSGGISLGFATVGAQRAKVTLTGRVVDTQTGEILGAVKGEGTGTGTSVSVDSYQGISFSGEQFQSTTLGKASDAAVKAFADNVSRVVESAGAKIRQESAKAALEGKVVTLVGSNVVVNLGGSKGIRKGASFQVYRLQTIEGLPDPLRVPVAKLKAVDVQGAASICEVQSKADEVQKGDVVVLE